MFRATINVAVAIIMSISAAASYAQNSVQQTPPELRDFRLDPEKPKPAPRPLPPETDVPATGPSPSSATPPVQIRPPASPPRGVITVPDVRPVTPRRTESARAEPSPAPIQERTAAPASVKPVTPVALPEAIPPAQPDPVIADPAPTVPAAPSADNEVTVAPTSAQVPYWWITHWWITVGALAAAGLAAAYAVTAFFRRRRRTTREGVSAHEDLNDAAPEPAASEAPGTPVPIATPAVPKHVLKRPNLDISFIPEKATISLAKLTIKGQIRIINQGNSAANAMRLRAVIISANIHQEQQIAAFHAHTQTPGDDIGTAAVGERIAMDIDLVIPLSELSSFAMGSKQLFAPIVAAHIDYAWDDDVAGSDTARISCLIGRESTPPKPKMGPLRLDLGPRSFAPLGQRPIFA